MTYDNPVLDGLDLGGTTTESVKEMSESNLIPTATYDGQVIDFAPQTSEKGVYEGMAIVKVTADLFNVEGRTRKHSFFISGHDRRDTDGKMRSEFKLANQLAKATGTAGKPLTETLEAAKLTALRFRIRLSPANDEKGYEARNWTDAITAVR